jgi:hypothetical protein
MKPANWKTAQKIQDNFKTMLLFPACAFTGYKSIKLPKTTPLLHTCAPL